MTLSARGILSSIQKAVSDADGLTRADWEKIKRRFKGMFRAKDLSAIHRMLTDSDGLAISAADRIRLATICKVNVWQVHKVFGKRGKRLKKIHFAERSNKDFIKKFRSSGKQQRMRVVRQAVKLALTQDVDISPFLITLPRRIRENPTLMVPLIEKKPHYMACVAPEMLRFPKKLALQAIKLGITYGSRFGSLDVDASKALAQIVANRLIPRKLDRHDPRPLAVLIFPKSDWNSAYQSVKYSIGLMNKGYLVRYYEVGTEDEFQQAIKDAAYGGKLIEFAVFAGHGRSRLLEFESPRKNATAAEIDESRLDPGDKADFARWRLGRFFAKDAHIVHDSCSNAKGGKANTRNQLNFMARMFPKQYHHAFLRPEGGYVKFNPKGLFVGMQLSGKKKVALMHHGTGYYREYNPSTAPVRFVYPKSCNRASTLTRYRALVRIMRDTTLPSNMRFAARYLRGWVRMSTWGKSVGTKLRTCTATSARIERMLLALLRSSDRHHRNAAMNSIAYEHKFSVGFIPQLIKLLDSSHLDVKLKVLSLLVNLGAKARAAGSAVVKIFDAENKRAKRAGTLPFGTNGLIRGAAFTIIYLGYVSVKALPVYRFILKSNDSLMKMHALHRIWKLGPKAISAAPDVIAALKTPYLRKRARKTLAKIGYKPPPAVRPATK